MTSFLNSGYFAIFKNINQLAQGVILFFHSSACFYKDKINIFIYFEEGLFYFLKIPALIVIFFTI